MRARTDLVILTNDSGPEAIAARESSMHVAGVFDSPIIHLKEKTWKTQVAHLSTDPLYFLATHGGWGENGELQSAMEKRGLRHTHSQSLSCAIMANKHAMKCMYVKQGIRTPAWVYQRKQFGSFSLRARRVEKPLTGGGGHRIRFTHATRPHRNGLIEEYVEGTLEVSVCVIGHTRRSVLPPRIRKRSDLSLGQAKLSRAQVPKRVLDVCEKYAERIHRALHAYGMTKTDFVLDRNLTVFALETDAIPGLGSTRAACTQARRLGMRPRALFELLCEEYVE